ncbi:hypothetical protein [Endozoicomonas sp. ONNA2]|uniref:hypothetical protein n=1 Tax=Endozoicomonas sp. ONNA2 TaxID=2828741 RepID=UPI002149754C|nr:hypothetical protein [Endozoicomonas sp. ONNA2]
MVINLFQPSPFGVELFRKPQQDGTSTSAVASIVVPTMYIHDGQTENSFSQAYNDQHHHLGEPFQVLTPTTYNQKDCVPTGQITGIKSDKKTNFGEIKRIGEVQRRKAIASLFEEIKVFIHNLLPFNNIKTRKDVLIACLWIVKKSSDPSLTYLTRNNLARLKAKPKTGKEERSLINNFNNKALRSEISKLFDDLKNALPGLSNRATSQLVILQSFLSFIDRIPDLKKFRSQSAQQQQSEEITDEIKAIFQFIPSINEYVSDDKQADSKLTQEMEQDPEEESTTPSIWSAEFVSQLLAGHETEDSLESSQEAVRE